MKVIAAAAAAALLSGSAMAADIYSAPAAITTSQEVSNIVGEVSLWVGAGFLEPAADSFSADTVFSFGGDGRAAWDMGNGYSLQFEAQGRGGFDYDPSDDDNQLAYGATAVHGFMRNGSNAYGGYASLYGGGNVDANDASYWLGGALEAASFMGSGTLFGQLGGGVLIGGTDSADNHYFARGGWRHFYNDYTTLEIDGLVGGYTGTSDEGDGWYANWGAELEHQYMDTPFAAFIAYRGYYLDQPDPGDSSTTIAEHVIKVGATLRFGGNARTVDHYMPFNVADHSNLLFIDDL